MDVERYEEASPHLAQGNAFETFDKILSKTSTTWNFIKSILVSVSLAHSILILPKVGTKIVKILTQISPRQLLAFIFLYSLLFRLQSKRN
jgi:hypothetical protein